jgi:hypothetical protein
MGKLQDLIKEEIKDRLPNYLGQTHYPCDIGFLLTESENCNGSWYCSRSKAIDDIKEYFDDFLEYQEWYSFTYGENEYFSTDSEHDIELIHCRMMINLVDRLFNKAYEVAYGNRKYNTPIKITQNFMDKIIEVMETQL